MGGISQLDGKESSQIRSHVVIDSFESVFRELLLNAVEAQSTSVVIKIDLASLSICCKDNGSGIRGEDMHLLWKRYHTSKNASIYSTLGWDMARRGESLHSIAQCSSSVVVESKTSNNASNMAAPWGTKAEIPNILRQFFDVQLESCSGTIVMVSRLFSHYPVRYRYSKSISGDNLKRTLKAIVFNLLQQHFSTRILIYFREKQDFDLVFNHDGSTSSKELFHKVFGVPLKNLYSVGGTNDTISLKGFLGVASQKIQDVFLDNQKVKLSRSETSALSSIFKAYGIQSGRQSIVSKSISLSPVYSFSISRNFNHYEDDWKSIFFLLKRVVVQSLEDLGCKRVVLSPKKPRTHSQKFPSTLSTSDISMADLVAGRFTLLGQLLKLVILISLKDSLYAIDQHACDERIRLEELLREYIENMFDTFIDLSVKCNSPISFSVSDESSCDFKEYKQELLKFGIQYDVEGNMIVITHLPQIMAKFNRNHLQECLQQCISDLRTSEKFPSIHSSSWFLVVKTLPAMILETLISNACKLSIKFGDTLNDQEMHYLLVRLGRCHLPLQCAHGRPTLVLIYDLDEMSGFREDEVL